MKCIVSVLLLVNICGCTAICYENNRWCGKKAPHAYYGKCTSCHSNKHLFKHKFSDKYDKEGSYNWR